jgi:hypothetical protein
MAKGVTVMRYANRRWTSLWGAVVALGGLSGWLPLSCGAAETAGASASDTVLGTWQHHKATLDYFGITSLYSCEGLEIHVRQILLHFGARKDLRVSAIGCPGPIDAPSRIGRVNADFYTLAPVDAGGSDTVRARWTATELTTRRPNFMGAGDCELIQQMKDLLTKNFSLRDVEYRADCFPHEVRPDGFAVKARALTAVPLQANAAEG